MKLPTRHIPSPTPRAPFLFFQSFFLDRNHKLSLQWSDSSIKNSCVFKVSAMPHFASRTLLASKVYPPTKSRENFAWCCKLTRRLHLRPISAVRSLSSRRTWRAHAIAATMLVQPRCSIAVDVEMPHIAMQSVNETIGSDTKSIAAP